MSTDSEKGNKPTTTFLGKNDINCPVCGEEFRKEELMTGRGRLIAGSLTSEFRRNYDPSKKYGILVPLIYPVTVCPNCLFSSFPKDFERPPGPVVEKLRESFEEWEEKIALLFPELNFKKNRTLKEGAASYILAVMAYEYFYAESSPTIKSGICCIRAAWLLSDFHQAQPGENYDKLSLMFYRKAAFYYSQAIEYEANGKESLGVDMSLGPDIDNNYGTDGVFYLSAMLAYNYGSKENPERRKQVLNRSRITVARIVGMGKASKNKPADLMDHSRDIHAAIGKEIKELEDAGVV